MRQTIARMLTFDGVDINFGYLDGTMSLIDVMIMHARAKLKAI